MAFRDRADARASAGTDFLDAGRVAALAVILFVGAVFNISSAAAQSVFEKTVPRSKTDLTFSYAPVVKKVTPAVVNVYVRSRVREQASPFANDPLFKRFFGVQPG